MPTRSVRPPGPVHLNLPFREPLVPTGAPLVDAPGRSHDRPWTARAPGVRVPSARDARRARGAHRRDPAWARGRRLGRRRAAAATLLRFAEVTGWPVLADPISNLRVPGTISTYDPLLRGAAFAGAHRPDVVLRVGGPLTNKVAMQWLDADIGQVLVDPDGAWLDPHHAVSGRMLADAEPLLAALTCALAGMTIDDAWRERWQRGRTRRPAPRSTVSSTAGTSRSKGASRATSPRAVPDGAVARARVEHARARRGELRRAAHEVSTCSRTAG